MSTLFLKIFLWFWLAMVVVTTVVFTQAQYIRANQTLLDRTLTPLLAQQSAEIFENYGPSEFPKYFQNFEKAFRFTGYFFNQESTELQGKAVPPEVFRITKLAASNDETQIVTINGRRFVGQQTVAPSGRHYLLVAQLSFPAFSDFLRAAPQIEIMRIGAVLLLSALVCFWLARYITAPVRELRTAANQLANGNLAARVGDSALGRHDEIAQLSRDFDNMAQRIESLVSSQQRLMTDISHELRSPLARLSIALGLARKQANPQSLAALDRIERESERLNDLIGNLLKLSRIEGQDASSSTRELIPVDELVCEVAADVDYEGRSRNRSVRVLRSESCFIFGIPELVRSAIENVVRNGINYTHEGTEVEISLEVSRPDQAAVICVRDHGDGVPNEDLENIFRPFFRVEDARERSSGGTGLGLAITERTVRLHRGRAKAENAFGGGLIVELRLPLASEIEMNGIQRSGAAVSSELDREPSRRDTEVRY